MRTLHGLTASHLERLVGMLPPPSTAAAAAGGQGNSSDLFRREVLGFKSTASSALAAVEDYAATAAGREERWTKRLQRAKEKAKIAQEL